jgi:ACS family tartrate transporter-like MFS transporter
MNEEDRVFAKCARHLIPLMVALYTVSFLDRVNVGFAALTMNKDLGFTPEIYGWGAGVFFIGYFLFEVPSNVILAHVGARRWICRIMLTWGAISAAFAFVQGPMSFYVLRFLLGLAEAGFSPGMIFYLSLWFPAALRARYAASYFIAVPLTNVIGAPLSSLILDMNGWLGLHGWQWLFLMEAVPALVLAGVVYFYLPNGPEDAPWLSRRERAIIAGRLASERGSGEAHIGGVWRALADARVLLMCAVYFAIVVGLYGITFWLPQIVQAMGFSNRSIGVIVAIPYAIAVIAMILWGAHSDATGERVLHVALASLLSAAAFALSAVLHSDIVILVALSLAAIGICSTLAPFWALPPLFLTGTGAAAGIALINATGNLGGVAGPYAVGWALQQTGGYGGGMAIMAASMALGAVLVLAMGRFKRLAFAA